MNAITLFRESPTIQDMADFMGSSNQNANKLYAKLLKDGYVTSQRDEENHRKQRLYLTEKTTVLLEHTRRGAGKNVNEIFSVVSEKEIETVIEVMAKLTDQLETLVKKPSERRNKP